MYILIAVPSFGCFPEAIRPKDRIDWAAFKRFRNYVTNEIN
jgi:hypothetical protein